MAADALRDRAGRGLAALVVGAVLVVAVVALRGRVTAVGGAAGLPGPWPSVAVVGLNLAGNALLADAWRRVVRTTGRALPYGVAARVWAVSQLARYALGAAQVAGRALAGRRHGVPAGAGAMIALVEVAWGTSLTAIVVLATAPAWLPGAGGLAWVGAVAVVPAALVVAGLVAPGRLLGMVAGLVRRLPGGLSRRLGGSGDLPAVTRADAAAITLRYAATIACRSVAVLVLYAAVGGDVRADGARAVGAWALGQVVGQLAVLAPGGLGPREGATVLVLAPALGIEAALLLAALVRLGELAAELLGVAVVRLLPVPAEGAAGAPNLPA